MKFTFNRDYGLTFEFHHRLKSIEGIKFKLENDMALTDIIGFRLTNPWTKNIHLIANKLKNHLQIVSTLITERDRVIYILFAETESGYLFEVQLWTSVMYHCFEYEHDRIYKPMTCPTEEMLAESKLIREKEHSLQDIIDQNIIIQQI